MRHSAKQAIVLGGAMVVLVIAGILLILKTQPSDEEEFINEIAEVSYCSRVGREAGTVWPVNLDDFKEALSQSSISFYHDESGSDSNPRELYRLKMSDGWTIELGEGGGYWYGLDDARVRTVTVTGAALDELRRSVWGLGQEE